MARACRGSSANLAVGTTLYVRHLPHLINIWLSTTRRSAVDHRDQPASATMPHAPQTRSSLSLPIGNSKGWRALKSTIDAAGWGMPIVRSLVCVRVTAECFRQERCILERNWPAGPRRPGRRPAVHDSIVEPVQGPGCERHQAAAATGVISMANPRFWSRLTSRSICLPLPRLSK